MPEISGRSPRTEVAVGWFPTGQWEEALQHWPDLLEVNPADHRGYSRKIQAALLLFQRELAMPLWVAPMAVEGLRAYAVEHGLEPGSGDARSSYAADLLRIGLGRKWPPKRNEPCWCESDRKYKACCGTVPMPEAALELTGETSPAEE